MSLYAIYQRLAVRALYMFKRCRSMTKQGDDFAFPMEIFDEPNGFIAIRKFPHGAIPARIKYGIEFTGIDVFKHDGVIEQPNRLAIIEELLYRIGGEIGPRTLGVDGRRPAFGRGDSHLKALSCQKIIGRGKFFQPNTDLFAGIGDFRR